MTKNTPGIISTGVNRGARSGKKDSVLFGGQLPDADTSCLVAVCVDDTDDISGDTSTGYVAESIARKVAGLGGCVVQGITRHQLLLAEGVPYTSHNSSMCFLAYVPAVKIDELEADAVNMIVKHKADASDPGLCIAVVSDMTCAQIDTLSVFGRRAQEEICTKEDAYTLAESISALQLTEHGGTGDGVIGALAGVGLRLSGNDGRFRGTWDLVEIFSCEHTPLSVAQLIHSLESKAFGKVDIVCNGASLDGQLPVRLSHKVKPYLKNGALTFDAEIIDGIAVMSEPTDNPAPGEKRKRRETQLSDTCKHFTYDNDIEECNTSVDKTCRNCLYRYWTNDNFECTYQ